MEGGARGGRRVRQARRKDASKDDMNVSLFAAALCGFQYMKVMNPLIDANMERIRTFFDQFAVTSPPCLSILPLISAQLPFHC